MSTRREHPTQTTGAHRAHSVRRSTPAPRRDSTGNAPEESRSGHGEGDRRAPHDRAGGESRHDAHIDGLFTYCLSVMCEHDAATAALGEALAVAERQRARGRTPAEPGLHRSWLYALARWACLRRLTQEGGTDDERASSGARAGTAGPVLSAVAATQRQRDLAALAWPEAAGTSPEQREALELAVRHGLATREVAAVVSLTDEATGDLLTSAACEVERTRAALAVVESGGCAAVGGLASDDRVLMGAALRRELVRHVDDCAECRRSAERAMAGVRWPGTAPAGSTSLTVLEAPRPAVKAALCAAGRARYQHTPRFARNGFPLAGRDRAARRDRLRHRAVTTTVVATVVAAPVLALWAAYRGAPLAGESDGAAPVSAADPDQDQEERAEDGAPYEKVGSARHGTDEQGSATESGDGSRSGGTGDGKGPNAGRPGGRQGELTISTRAVRGGTLVTLTATGEHTVRWSASVDAAWLTLSQVSGVLRPGESTSVTVRVVEEREPVGTWSARLTVAPVGAVVTFEGRGTGADGPSDAPHDPGDGTQQPSPDPSPEPDPTPGGSSPSPEPTGTRDPEPTPT